MPQTRRADRRLRCDSLLGLRGFFYGDVIRALGPSLSVPGKMADPTLELRDSNGTLLEANDNWRDSPNKQAIINSTIPPTNDLESAIVGDAAGQRRILHRHCPRSE
jgi:hypothetical protein